MIKVILYSNGGSKNHGCEAITRGTCNILKLDKTEIKLISNNIKEDKEYKLEEICKISDGKPNIKRFSKEHIKAVVKSRLFGDENAFVSAEYSKAAGKFEKSTIAVSVGGDNYCYNNSEWLYYLHKKAIQKCKKTVLYGCSIEPKAIDEKMVLDLKKYDLIIARESITYEALIERGIDKNTHIFPDPAFQLEKINVDLPKGFLEGNTIGINLSPLIMKCENKQGATFENFKNLINHILSTTDSNIALIPHVTWENNNDARPLSELYEIFKETNRLILLATTYNAMELKGFISQCRIFIGARTHATIAAYSTCVPTLVVGYSVKALGIAKDIFGREENMVIPVQSLKNKDDLIQAFEYIRQNEIEIRRHLEEFMPKYKKKALEAGKEIRKLF